MKKTKVVQFMECLSREDMVEFGKFLRSPYFNSNQEVIGLFDALKDFYPEFDELEIKKQAVFNQAFSGQSFDESKLYRISKLLLQLLKEYLTVHTLRADTRILQERYLVDAILQRDLHKYLPRLLEDTIESLDVSELKNSDHYYKKFQMAQLRNKYKVKLQDRTAKVSYGNALHYLDMFYLLQKLQYACVILNREKAISEPEEILLLPEILAYCNAETLETYPGLAIYYYTFLMLWEKKDEHFFKVKEVMDRHQTVLANLELKNAYVYQLNYCILRYRQGQVNFLNEMFEVYLRMIDLDLVVDGTLTGTMLFKNIVTLGIKLERLDWVDNFIQSHRAKLDPVHGESVYFYSMANVNFVQGKFRKTLSSLAKIDFADAFIRMNHDILLLKTYYECDETESFLSLINTIRVYIRRNKSLSDNDKAAYGNVVKFVRRLSRLKNGKKNQLMKLKEEIKACAMLVEREWLNQKINELEMKIA